MPTAVFTSGTCSGESQKRHFMSLSGSSNDNFVHVWAVSNPQQASV